MLGRPSVLTVSIELPILPISTNELWAPVLRRKGKRVWPALACSKDYLDWISLAGFHLNRARPGMVSGAYALTIKVSSKWRGDIGNAEKAISDLLQSQGVIENDRKCERLLTERSAAVRGIFIQVTSMTTTESDGEVE